MSVVESVSGTLVVASIFTKLFEELLLTSFVVGFVSSVDLHALFIWPMAVDGIDVGSSTY
jgi:hypothetical protein